MAVSGCINDNSFGPVVEGCRGGFDFTFRFQNIILGIVPAAIFIPIALTRLATLAFRSRIVGGKVLQFTKLAVIAVTAALQLVLLILSSTSNDESVDAFAVADSALGFAEWLVILALSFAEHSRAPRPSSILTLYLLLQILLDVARSRSYWLMAGSFQVTRYAGIFTATVPFKVITLLLELQSKARWMRWRKEDHSPEETSSLFNLGVYFWLIRIFRNGFKKVLSIKDDLYILDHEMQSRILLDRLATQFANSSAAVGKRFRLAKALGRALIIPILLPVLPRLAMIGFQYSQPFFIHALLEYLTEKDVPKNHGYGLIGAATIIYAGVAVSDALFWYFHQRSLYMARGCLASYVYRSTTQGKMTDIGDAAVLTLMSTDVERIIYGFHGLHDFWANIIEIGLGCFLLQQELGLAFISPIVVILLCVAVTSAIAWVIGERQSRWMARIESRVGLTSSIISNIKSLRISGITAPVRELVQKMREQELSIGNKFRWLLILTATIAFVPSAMSPVVAFAFTNEQLDTLKIFVSFSFITLLTNPLGQMFQSVPAVIAAFVCLERIQKFLEIEPRVDYRRSSLPLPPAHGSLLEQGDEKIPPLDLGQGAPKSLISVIDGSFGWTSDKMTLKDISVDVPVGKLTLVVGPVASGKSTFCKALLGEVPFSSGQVILPSTQAAIGYCEQMPFLKNGSIRDNIIWHSVYNQNRYEEVLDACLLRTDLDILPEGDATAIGSNGIMLSGGQKQRVSLARALYLETDFLLIDDILSGLDNSTGNDVFRRVFGPNGLMRRRNATAILCTHAIRYLPLADHIIVLEADGTVSEQGSFDKLVETGTYVRSLGISDADEASDTEPSTPIEETVAATMPVTPTAHAAATIANLEAESRATGDARVYRHYYRSVSGWATLTCLLSGILYAVGRNFPSIWMGFWASNSFNVNSSFYVGIMGLFRGLQVIALFFCATAVVIFMTTQSGKQLHGDILDTLVNAPLRFFTTTDFGAVTNLFSQDMTLIDGELPISLLNTVIQVFDVLAMAVVVAVGAPWLAIAYPLVFAIIYTLQMFYLRTSRQLRLLDLEAKSPLYAHFLDTIRGIATVRAQKLREQEILHNQDLLDLSQRPAYLLAMAQRFLASCLNLMVMVLAIGVVTISTQLRTNSGFAGSSLVTLMTWGDSISSLIQYYTQVEISIGAVSRLKAFAENVASENLDGEDLEPPEEWPTQGNIVIRGISASYKNEDESPASEDDDASPNLALENITISVKPGQKVALCGRTGSGKSSIILLLLRLLDPLSNLSGNIEIDGVPYNRVDRSVLRRRLIAVPQDPVFLPDGSSIKENLDPSNVASDLECLAVLEDVRLTKFANDHGSIHTGIRADELSAGQKQLFSLGRALLRHRVKQRLCSIPGGVLLLDEVSSSVDSATDNLVQEIIKEEFSDYTIVMVSHRLTIVVEYFDSVVVLDRGRVVETGNPRDLAKTNGSWFSKLWAMEKK